MAKIIPAILAHSYAEATKKLRAIEPFSDWVQLDCLDGQFVPNRSFFDPSFVEEEAPSCSIELHLMVQQPQPIIEKWQPVSACKRVIWHIEAPIDHAALIEYCRSHHFEVGLALSPGTSPERLRPFLAHLDTVLLLSVHPGWSGQPFLPQTMDTIDHVRKLAPQLAIGIDGGVDDAHIPSLVTRGVSFLYLATALFDHPPLADRFHSLELLATPSL